MTGDSDNDKKAHLTPIEKKALEYVYKIYQTNDKNDIANFIEPYSKQNIDMSMKYGNGSEGNIYKGKGEHRGRAYKIISHKIDFKDLEIDNEVSLIPDGQNSKNPILNSPPPNEHIISKKISLNELFGHIKILVHTNHQHIVNFYGICLDPLVIIMEFCEKGSLCSYIREFTKLKKLKPTEFHKKYSFKIILRLLKQIAEAMIYLHSEKNIVHGDLKPSNILLDKNSAIKITDFGFAHVLNKAPIKSTTSDTITRHGVTNPQWLAPEVLCGEAYSKKADVYSFSMIMWELLALEKPWQKFNDGRKGKRLFNEISKIIMEGKKLDIPDNLENESNVIYCRYIKLMEQCWNDIPESRPSFETIYTVIEDMEQFLEHEKISSVECSSTVRDFSHGTSEFNFDLKINRLLKQEGLPSNDDICYNWPHKDPEPQNSPFIPHQVIMTKENNHLSNTLHQNNTNSIEINHHHHHNKINIKNNNSSSTATGHQSMEIRVINEADSN